MLIVSWILRHLNGGDMSFVVGYALAMSKLDLSRVLLLGFFSTKIFEGYIFSSLPVTD